MGGPTPKEMVVVRGQEEMYFGGKKGISRNKTSFFLLMA